MTGVDGDARHPAAVPRPRRPDLVGIGDPRRPPTWTAEQGMNLMSSTLLSEDTGVPFDELQAEQIALYRAAWAQAGWEREPRVSVSRSVIPIVTDEDRRYFGDRARARRRPTRSASSRARSRASARATSASPTRSRTSSSRDAAVRAADTLLLTVPNQLGVDYNARLLESFASFVGPAIGWQPAGARDDEPARRRGGDGERRGCGIVRVARRCTGRGRLCTLGPAARAGG